MEALALDSKTPRWLGSPLREVAVASPQVALARALGIPLRPFVLSIVATFADTTTVIGPFSWSITGGVAGGPADPVRLFQFAIVDRMVFEVDQPNANPGAQLKPVSDFFFGLQSGIKATMTLDPVGSGYVIAPDFTPIRSLMAMVNEAWAYGWVLNWTNAIRMQFQPSVLLTTPTTITCTFRMWQVSRCLDMFTGLSDHKALEMLKERGCDVSGC